MVKVLTKSGGIVVFECGTHYGIGQDGILYIYEFLEAKPVEAVAAFKQWDGAWNTLAVSLSFA